LTPAIINFRKAVVDVLHVILQILLGITSLLLTLLILLHKGRGGGLSDMFGGGMSSGLSSSGVAERNLNRFTIILGVTWGVVIIALGLLMRFSSGGDS
jgi:preprotein translocase subunit SecG